MSRLTFPMSKLNEKFGKSMSIGLKSMFGRWNDGSEMSGSVKFGKPRLGRLNFSEKSGSEKLGSPMLGRSMSGNARPGRPSDGRPKSKSKVGILKPRPKLRSGIPTFRPGRLGKS